MRLATFNLLHGRSLTDGLVDPNRLAAAVTALDADVLALQEVDRDQSRSGNLDLTAIAAQALNADEHRFAAAVVGTPGIAFRPLTHDDDGHGEPCYGVGLISRHPVTTWQVTRLRAAPVRSPVYAPGPGLILLRDEPRVLLAAVLDTPHGQLTVAATHLSFVPGWNIHQLRQVVRALRTLPAPESCSATSTCPPGPPDSPPAGTCSAADPPTRPPHPASNSTTPSPTGAASPTCPRSPRYAPHCRPSPTTGPCWSTSADPPAGDRTDVIGPGAHLLTELGNQPMVATVRRGAYRAAVTRRSRGHHRLY